MNKPAVNAPMQERRKSNFPVPEGYRVVTLLSGDCYVTDQPSELLVTILGSCVSACIRDPFAGVGGMNHFLLPHMKHMSQGEDNVATRYGAFAMEQLINGILQLGGVKSRLEVKLFGGGNVIQSNTLIGEDNVRFAKEFLRKEGLLIHSSDLGGTHPRRIHYYPDTGQVMMRNLSRKGDDVEVATEEQQFAQRLIQKPIEGEVDLF